MDLSIIKKTQDIEVADFDLSEVRSVYEEILEAQEEVGGTILYRAKIPSGGGKAFDILTGNEDMDTSVQKLVGVVIHSHKCNALFDEDAQDTPPICSSQDGIIGVCDQGEYVCADCPHNQYGTAKGGTGAGKACKNMIRLYMMIQGSPIPLLVTLPPTSMKNWQNYRLGVLSPRRMKTYDVVTELSLTAETNKAGIRYSVVRPRLIGKLSDADRAHAAFFASGFRPHVKMEADDYNIGDAKEAEGQS